MEYDLIIVGAGAAGMMAAYSASVNNLRVLLIERNEKPGKKIYITGKGRCNLTNNADIETVMNNIVRNKKFMFSALYGFTNRDVIEFFENNGMKTKVERGNRVFPVSDKSSDVINTLRNVLENNGVEIIYNTKIVDVLFDNENSLSGVADEKGKKYISRNVVFATGGLSYPITGSDGLGMKILEKYGHTKTKLTPALVPMNVEEEWVKELQGLSLKNVSGCYYIKKKNKKKVIYEDFGEMLFTHFGISGPIVLSASSHISKYIGEEKIWFGIDFKPALSEEQLDARLLREFEKNINKDFKNCLSDLLPKKIIPVMIEYCGIDPYKKVNVISREERATLIRCLKSFEMTISSFRGFNEAIITQGGISVKEINPATMESKIIPGLYIAGEMIDVDAVTGGYNLQIAWSTGYVAGLAAAEKIQNTHAY